MVISFRKTIEKDKVIVPLTNAEDGDGQSWPVTYPLAQALRISPTQCHQPRHRPNTAKDS